MAIDKIDLNNLDKSDWKTYRFDEIAQNISERVDPNETDLEVYIGLEHLDSESLHITRHGSPDDVNGTKLRFYKGDIIFGRRRAYQRKAGIATCDGFCSAHALVLRANPDVIDPNVFSFFIHSDLFMNRAVDISVGSLSPTINWGTLKEQEFLIPPLKLQKKLVSLLLSIDNAKQSKTTLIAKTETLMSAMLTSYFSYQNSKACKDKYETELGWIPKGWKVVEQQEIAKFINGRAFKKTEWEETGTPVIRLQNLTGTGDKYYYSNLDLPEHQYCVEGDLLYMWSATFGAKFWYGPKAIFHYHIWKIECNEDVILKKFMFYNLEETTRRMMRQVSGSTMPHITKSGMEKLKIVLPPIEFQNNAVKKLDLISASISELEDTINQFNKLYKSILNKVF